MEFVYVLVMNDGQLVEAYRYFETMVESAHDACQVLNLVGVNVWDVCDPSGVVFGKAMRIPLRS